MVIFDALHQLQDSHIHEAQIEAGATLEEHEPLLPADPPTPPPASLTPPPATLTPAPA